MAHLDAELIWEDGVHFVGTSPSGHTIHLDGNKTAGASPMELILLGLGGCASYDVVTIMKNLVKTSRMSVAKCMPTEPILSLQYLPIFTCILW